MTLTRVKKSSLPPNLLSRPPRASGNGVDFTSLAREKNYDAVGFAQRAQAKHDGFGGIRFQKDR